jgi:hypothetical protein
MLRLPEKLRNVFAKPQGRLYRGKGIEVFEKIEELEGYEILACIGDLVTYHALKLGFKPHILVIDRRTVREELKADIIGETDALSKAYKEIWAENPPGCLTANLVRALLKAVELAIDGRRVKVVVDGEEDLAVIPLVRFLPNGSLIIYGQPGEGVVVLRVDWEKKALILKLLEEMEKVDNNGEDAKNLLVVDKWRL